MMHPMTPTTALLWRQWRETQWFLVGAVTLNAVAALGFAAVQSSDQLMNQQELAMFVYLVLSMSAIIAGLPLLFSQGLNGRLATNLTAQWFTLPVKSGSLAVTILGYRVGAFVAVLLTGPGLFLAVSYSADDTGLTWLGDTVKGTTPFLFIKLALTAYVFVQAIEWSLRRISPWLAWPVLIAGPLAVYVWWITPGVEVDNVATYVAAPALPLALVVSATGVIGQRHGFWEALATDLPRRTAASAAKKPFHSPDAALRWYAWRRSVWLVPAAWAASLLAIATGPFGDLLAGSARGVDIGKLLEDTVALVAFSALFFGLFLPLLWNRDARVGRGAYLFAIPVSTERHAAALFQASARAIVLSLYVPLIADLLLAAYLSTQHPEVGVSMMLRSITFTFLPAFLAMTFVTMWCGYLGGLLYAGGYAVLMLISMVQHNAATDLSISVMPSPTMLSLACLAVAAVCAYYAVVHAHVTLRGVSMAILFALVIAALTAIGVYPMIQRADFVIAASTASIVPVAFWPAYLAWLRTR